MTNKGRAEQDIDPDQRGLRCLAGLAGVLALIEGGIVLGAMLGGRGAGLRSLALEYGAFWPGLLYDWVPNYTGQPWGMFLTYAFLHSGPVHLVVNLITLFSLGRIVIARAGVAKFAALYGAAMLGGAIAFGLLATGPQPMVGASGALFGLAGAVLAWDYLDRFSERLSLWPVGRAMVLLLALNLVLWWAMDGLLAWQTHLGGFLAGWVMAMLLDPVARRA
ncbi:MAG: rhomboid family intramembrane serine protease [Pseudomonadota bacterium]